MKTFFAITAIVLASLWVLRFIVHFMYLVEYYVDDNDISRVSIYIQESWFNCKILSWQTFWILVIRCSRWEFQLLSLITGAPIWGFVLYIIIESMIITVKRIYNWLKWQ